MDCGNLQSKNLMIRENCMEVKKLNLVERHAYKPQHSDYAELDHICFLSKNLYNATLYAVRQHYFNTGQYLNYNAVNLDFTHSSQPDYIALPRKVSKMTQKLVDKNFVSFFALLKAKKAGTLPHGFNVRIPKYKHKEKGRQIVHYDKQALSVVEAGFVKLSGTNIKIRTQRQDIRFVRVVPKENGIIMVEIGYRQETRLKQVGTTAAIDLGVDNLATVTSPSFKPFILNGKPMKSVNQYYNKRLAELKSRQDLSCSKRKSTKRIRALTNKRNNKINDYMHKATRDITNQLDSKQVVKLVVGYNKGWKQDVNLGNKTNQNFVQIPFLRFIQMLVYKCELAGIEVTTVNEAYTSKCSFLDNEPIGKHKSYMGRRVKRGLYKSANGVEINADVNASYNILSKVAENLNRNSVEMCSTPLVFTIKK
jgi:putative transposase